MPEQILSSSGNNILAFSLVKIVFFDFFCFSLYKFADSEYRADNSTSLKFSIGAIIKKV